MLYNGPLAFALLLFLAQQSIGSSLRVKAYFAAEGNGPAELARALASASALLKAHGPNTTLEVCREHCDFSAAAFSADLKSYDILWFEGKQFLQPHGDLLSIDPVATKAKVIVGKEAARGCCAPPGLRIRLQYHVAAPPPPPAVGSKQHCMLTGARARYTRPL